MTHDPILAQVLDVARATFRVQRELSERAMAQLDDAEFFRTIDDESNSVAIIARHVGGNLRSRWTDFLTTDGEKPDRNRDGEFEIAARPSRDAVMADWESGWAVLFATLDSLTEDDVLLEVTIRGEAMSVIQALDRQMTHHAYHVGQIVFIAKHLRAADWRTLSLPRRRTN